MKKIIVVFFILTSVLLQSSGAYAVNIFPGCSSGSLSSTTVCKDVRAQQGSNQNEFVVIIKDVINVMSVVVGISAIILIVVSGLRMTLSGGDTKTVSEARSGLFMALVGIFIVTVAQLVVVFVLNKLQ